MASKKARKKNIRKDILHLIGMADDARTDIDSAPYRIDYLSEAILLLLDKIEELDK